MSIGADTVYLLLFISLYFEVFMLVAFLERARYGSQKISPINTDVLPSVAIIVPCMNEETTIASTLSSLLALDYPPEKLEIIVVDDGSIDHTLSVAREFETVAFPRLSVFHKENGGKHSAMNLGLAHTSAELIGCLDADSIVAPEALLSIVPVFENARVAAVTPGIHVKNPQNIIQYIQHVEYRLSIFVRFTLAALGSVYITPGPFSIFRTAVVRQLDGWRHGHSTEDMEMALRMQAKGYLIGNAPNAIVYTATPRTFTHLFRQRVRWTYGFLRNMVDYRRMFGNYRYGNLGILILPAALISIGAGIFFFLRIVFNLVNVLLADFTRVSVTGVLPHATFDAFYINTSVLLFLVFSSIILILVLICVGSFIGTGSRRPPISTPLFMLFYAFIAPLWLGVAVVRAVFKTGVRWR